MPLMLFHARYSYLVAYGIPNEQIPLICPKMCDVLSFQPIEDSESLKLLISQKIFKLITAQVLKTKITLLPKTLIATIHSK